MNADDLFGSFIGPHRVANRRPALSLFRIFLAIVPPNAWISSLYPLCFYPKYNAHLLVVTTFLLIRTTLYLSHAVYL